MVFATHPAEPFDLADLVELPDDGLRYEVLDGALVVNPAPSWRHQRAADRLVRILGDAAPSGVEVISAPMWRIGPGQVPEPDVVVAHREALGDLAVESTPILVVEVLSPSNRGADLVRKRALYADAGCPAFWVVDPTGPSVLAFTLTGGSYVEEMRATGDERLNATLPFPVSFSPADLTSD